MKALIQADLERLERNLGALLQFPARTALMVLGLVAAVVVALAFLRLPVGLVVVGAALAAGAAVLGRTRLFIVVFLAAALVVLPFVTGDQYWLRVTVTLGIFVLLALGLNVIVGFTGVLDLGFIAFYGIGAYTAALLMLKLH